LSKSHSGLTLKGLPASNPDTIAGVCVIKLEFEGPPVTALEGVYAPARLAADGQPLAFVSSA